MPLPRPFFTKKTFLMLAGIAVCAAVLALPYVTRFGETMVVIRRHDGTFKMVDALVADNFYTLHEGLKEVKELQDDAGMLFVFKETGLHPMWMKDTYIPLDMIFIREGRIVHIAEHMEPLTEQPVSPPEAVDRVLEINGGAATRFGLKVGDQVLY